MKKVISRMANRHWIGLALAAAVPVLAQSNADFHMDVQLVRVPCVITDREGKPVRGLSRDDFVVLEDGVRQSIKYVWQEADLPLTVGLVVDVSGSERRFIQQHQETVLAFLQHVLSPRDRAFLVAVSLQHTLEADLTSSIDGFRLATEALGKGPQGEILGERCAGPPGRFRSCGGTALWNGIYFAATLKMRPQFGRKALLVLTDGLDTGSDHGLAEAIAACQGSDAPVYTIRYADPHPVPDAPTVRVSRRVLRRGKRHLERIARETGGVAFEGESENVRTVFDRIESDLRYQYLLGYTPATDASARRFRRIQVKLRRPGLGVRARQGYAR